MTTIRTLEPGAEDVLGVARELAKDRGESRISPHVLLVARQHDRSERLE